MVSFAEVEFELAVFVAARCQCWLLAVEFVPEED